MKEFEKNDSYIETSKILLERIDFKHINKLDFEMRNMLAEYELCFRTDDSKKFRQVEELFISTLFIFYGLQEAELGNFRIIIELIADRQINIILKKYSNIVKLLNKGEEVTVHKIPIFTLLSNIPHSLIMQYPLLVQWHQKHFESREILDVIHAYEKVVIEYHQMVMVLKDSFKDSLKDSLKDSH
jgi:hypothetical protein